MGSGGMGMAISGAPTPKKTVKDVLKPDKKQTKKFKARGGK